MERRCCAIFIAVSSPASWRHDNGQRGRNAKEGGGTECDDDASRFYQLPNPPIPSSVDPPRIEMHSYPFIRGTGRVNMSSLRTNAPPPPGPVATALLFLRSDDGAARMGTGVDGRSGRKRGRGRTNPLMVGLHASKYDRSQRCGGSTNAIVIVTH